MFGYFVCVIFGFLLLYLVLPTKEERMVSKLAKKEKKKLKKDKKKWAEQDKEFEEKCREWDKADFEWKLKHLEYELFDEVEFGDIPNEYKGYIHGLVDSWYFPLFSFSKDEEKDCFISADENLVVLKDGRCFEFMEVPGFLPCSDCDFRNELCAKFASNRIDINCSKNRKDGRSGIFKEIKLNEVECDKCDLDCVNINDADIPCESGCRKDEKNGYFIKVREEK